MVVTESQNGVTIAQTSRVEAMGLQLQSADFLHDDGLTYCIRRESLDQDFTIYEKRDGDWVDADLDQAVKDFVSTSLSSSALAC